jgi:hypothetical protein
MARIGISVNPETTIENLLEEADEGPLTRFGYELSIRGQIIFFRMVSDHGGNYEY